MTKSRRAVSEKLCHCRSETCKLKRVEGSQRDQAVTVVFAAFRSFWGSSPCPAPGVYSQAGTKPDCYQSSFQRRTRDLDVFMWSPLNFVSNSVFSRLGRSNKMYQIKFSPLAIRFYFLTSLLSSDHHEHIHSFIPSFIHSFIHSFQSLNKH